MDTRRLKATIMLNGDTQGSLSKYLDISEQSLSNKINEKNGSEFTQGEILMIKI